MGSTKAPQGAFLLAEFLWVKYIHYGTIPNCYSCRYNPKSTFTGHHWQHSVRTAGQLQQPTTGHRIEIQRGMAAWSKKTHRKTTCTSHRQGHTLDLGIWLWTWWGIFTGRWSCIFVGAWSQSCAGDSWFRKQWRHRSSSLPNSRWHDKYLGNNDLGKECFYTVSINTSSKAPIRHSIIH